jgi:HlyD family secretion protein
VVALSILAIACAPEGPDNALRVSGHVEATEVHVSSEVGGRLLELRVDEGDRVKIGDVLAKIDTRDTALQIQRARAERATAVAQLRLLEAGSRIEDVRQAEAQVDAAQAEAMAIEADLKAAQLDLERLEALLNANAIAQKERDDAKTRVEATRERLRSAGERVRAARENVTRLKKGARPEEIEAARAHVAAADAQIALLDKALSDAQILAPVSGVVTQKLVDAGEIVMRGTPIVVVTDLDNAWANLFVPEPMVPRVKLGQPAKVVTDAGGEGLSGRVTFVSPKAEFTPRNVQTAEERSKLVYRIKVTVDNRAGILKPGMPVDAELVLQ